MKTNTAMAGFETEDIIYDDPEIYDTKVDEKMDGNTQIIDLSSNHGGTNSLEALIEKLPEQFPEAVNIIKDEIAPLMIDCNAGVKDHYVKMIRKKTNAASIKSVSLIIDEAIERINAEEPEPEKNELDEIRKDPEIQKMAEQIAHDPLLLKNRIDLIGRFGVVGERKNIGFYMTVIDSCLLPMGSTGSEALAIKNSGPYGAGKSHPMFACLKLYPKSAYHLITSGSAKSLYHVQGGLKHKALILTEALALQGENSGDNELAYSIRSLVSEGSLSYQYTGYDEDGNKRTIIRKMDGPTSLITTTIKGRLEAQLEDRLITIHPNTSSKQTQDILNKTAEIASGSVDQVDEKTINAWKLFYDSLEFVEVVIPFAGGIAEFINASGKLPIAARRAFKRVLSVVKTISTIHQKQRRKDDMGRVIAEMQDYAIAFQLINDSFMESLGEGKKYTDARIKIIEKNKMISSKDLSKVTGVSGAAISQWMKPLIDDGVLAWCDEKGDEFEDTASLEKAKRSGSAFVRVAYVNSLPTPFQLTGDKRWDKDGDLYIKYDLGFDEDNFENPVLGEGEEFAGEPKPLYDLFDLKVRKDDEKANEGVNVLSSKYGPENKKTETNEEIDNISDEFKDILSLDKYLGDYQNDNGRNCNTSPHGLLTI